MFATLKQARERAEIIKSFDPVFDLFIIDMWKWIPFPPKPNIHREGEDRVDMLNNFFERTEASQAEMRQRVEATRELGKAAPPSSSSSSRGARRGRGRSGHRRRRRRRRLTGGTLAGGGWGGGTFRPRQPGWGPKIFQT